jgi:hypothetical protein
MVEGLRLIGAEGTLAFWPGGAENTGEVFFVREEFRDNPVDFLGVDLNSFPDMPVVGNTTGPRTTPLSSWLPYPLLP